MAREPSLSFCCIDLKRAWIKGDYYITRWKTIRNSDTDEVLIHCPFCHYNRCSRCKVFVTTVWSRPKTRGWGHRGQRCRNCLTEKDKEILNALAQIFASSKSDGFTCGAP